MARRQIQPVCPVAGELHADSGDALFPAGWTVAHVAQETPALSCSALDYVLDGDAELRALEQQLAPPKPPTMARRLAACTANCRHRRLRRPARAGKLLAGLGF